MAQTAYAWLVNNFEDIFSRFHGTAIQRIAALWYAGNPSKRLGRPVVHPSQSQ